tara:strand:+ start:292 stop:480 length:189 start_codon:yes stop_codon:yes gene_type:complete
MILGADGYLGLPTSVDLALEQHDLLLIDNYIKKRLMNKNKRKPLVKKNKIEKNIDIWLKKKR